MDPGLIQATHKIVPLTSTRRDIVKQQDNRILQLALHIIRLFINEGNLYINYLIQQLEASYIHATKLGNRFLPILLYGRQSCYYPI